MTRIWKYTSPNPGFIFLGVRGASELPPLALRVLHAIIWKFLLIEFYRARRESTPFNNKHIMSFAYRRLQVRLNSVIYEQLERHRTAKMYNKKQPNNDKVNERIHPFATLEDDTVTWHIKDERDTDM